MPQVATPGLVEIVCQLSGAVGSGPHYNVWHFDDSAGASTAGTNAVPWLGTFYNAIKSYFHSGATMTAGYKVIDRSAVPWSFIPVTPVVMTATGSTGNLAPQLAMVVSWKTNQVGRSYRGRTFLGPMDQAASSGAAWSGASTLAAQNAALALIASTSASTTKLAVYSHRHNTWAPVNAATVSSVMRTMRSRA